MNKLIISQSNLISSQQYILAIIHALSQQANELKMSLFAFFLLVN